MTPRDFDNLTDQVLSQVVNMKNTKGKEYANSEIDRLANFYDIAKETGASPLVVWSVYFKKHLRAIDFFVKNGNVRSESIEGRFVDAITYLLLGYGLVVEHIQANETRRQEDLNQMCQYCVHKRIDHILIVGGGRCTKCSCAQYEPAH